MESESPNNNFTVPCEFCETPVRPEFYATHLEFCQRNPYVKNQEKAGIPCEICNEEIPFDKYNEHYNSHQAENANRSRNDNAQEQLSNQPRNRQQLNRSEESSRRGGLSESPSRHETSHRANTRARSSPEDILLNGLFGGLLGGHNPTNPFVRGTESQSNRDVIQQPSHSWNPFPSLDSMFGGGGEMSTMQQPNRSQPRSQVQIVFGGPNRVVIRRIVGPGDEQGAPNVESLGLHDLFAALLGGHQDEEGLNAFFDGMGLRRPEAGFKKEDLDRNFITAKYDEKKSANLDEEYKRCSICLSDFADGDELRFLECCHRFHSQCIDVWMQKHTTCPICKKDFKNFDAGQE